MHEFESVRNRIADAREALDADERRPLWFADSKRIGIARDESGRFEIFLAVAGLQVNSALINQYIAEDTWSSADGRTFFAARLVIPGDPHFIGIAALIVDELIRNGFDADPQSSFTRSEALIEMALERVGISDETALGLLGELIILEQLLVLHPATVMRQRALSAWTGHQRTSRDFMGNGVSIEVKTTRSNKSRHYISNLDQVTQGQRRNGSETDRLFLASLGLFPSAATGRSVASQTERICQLLGGELQASEAAQSRGAFIQCLRRYGIAPGGAVGYDHESMRMWPIFASTWEVRFFRIYDMADPMILVPRRNDLAQFRHLLEESVRFEIDLPDIVRGDINPTMQVEDVLSQLLGQQPA
jgi:hypothetical protein